jgi:uncharacterized protein DUF3558
VRRVVVLAAFAMALAGVAGCGAKTVGRASPVIRTSTAVSSPSSSVSAGGLPGNHACSLLSSADLRQLGASSPPTQEMIGTAHACDFDSDEFAMGVVLTTDAGLAVFDPAGGVVHDTTIGSHQARQVAEGKDTCYVVIGVSPSSRVDVDVTGDGTTDPCPTALTLARLVERRLPSD